MQSIAFFSRFNQAANLSRICRYLVLTSASLLFFLNSPATLLAQDSLPDKSASSLESLQRHLKAGEFSVAERLIERLPEDQKDQGRVLLFQAQAISGAAKGALTTVDKIENDPIRNAQMNWLRRQMTDQSFQAADSASRYENASSAKPGTRVGTQQQSANSQGRRGGISEADFTSLIELITSTIAPNSWSDGGGSATIRAYPSGVFVDSTGTLKRIRVEPLLSMNQGRNRLSSANLASKNAADWFQDSGNRYVRQTSKLRKVSLTRLERVAQIRYSMGVPFDDSMLNLAGLNSVDYVYFDPNRGEVIIAGPAGGWEIDDTGRTVNTQNRKPVMQLDDFVVCHRNARHEGGKFGCTIDPKAENLKAANEIIRKGVNGKSQREKLRDALGKQDISVFGIDPRTHAGRILVEADHHMKLVGMGLAKSIPQVPSYFDRLEGNQLEGLRSNEVIRWWFAIREADLFCDEAMEFFDVSRVGVKVLSESEMLSNQGERIHTGSSTAPTQGFAHDFTDNFATMALQYPVYQELKNIFSLAVVANLIRVQQFEKRGGRSLEFFDAPKSSQGLSYPTRLMQSPTQVDSVLNHKVLSQKKQQSTLQTTVLGVSGGVEVNGVGAVKASKIKTTSEMSDLKKRESDRELSTIWWWD